MKISSDEFRWKILTCSAGISQKSIQHVATCELLHFPKYFDLGFIKRNGLDAHQLTRDGNFDAAENEHGVLS